MVFGNIAFVVLGLTAGFAVAAKKCYFPDGRTSDASYVPCLPNNDEGFCCHANDYCTENGFCLSVLNGYHYRGACTDSGWLSESCPTACLDNVNCRYLRVCVLGDLSEEDC